MSHLADPRTPEAICQLQLVSCVHCAVVIQTRTCWSVYVCLLMIDMTFQLQQIIDINQTTEAFKNSGIHELNEVNAVITKVAGAIRTPAQQHWTDTSTSWEIFLFAVSRLGDNKRININWILVGSGASLIFIILTVQLLLLVFFL